jgi:hypothetical protein
MTNNELNVLQNISAAISDPDKKDVPTREELLRAEALKAAAAFLDVEEYSERHLFKFADECLQYIKGEKNG